MKSKVNERAYQHRATLIKAIVKKYGNKAVTLSDIIKVRNKLGRERYFNATIYVRKSGKYKVARNQYRITTK